MTFSKQVQRRSHGEEIEWERFPNGERVLDLQSKCGLYSLPEGSEIEIYRDEQYKLRGVIRCTTLDPNALEPQRRFLRGERIPDEVVIGATRDRCEYEFYGFLIHGVNVRAQTATGLMIYEGEVSFDSVRGKSNRADDIKLVRDYFICGRPYLHFPRSTKRSFADDYEWSRDHLHNEPSRVPTRLRSTSRDCFRVSALSGEFWVAQIPQGHGPDWACGFCIEYEGPSVELFKEHRVAIAEFVGFILGLQLLRIATAHFDGSFERVFQESCNPWGKNARSRCSDIARPPVNLREDDWAFIEKICGALLDRYLECRGKLRLSEVIWKYWLARDAVIGTNLPILASALEQLAYEDAKVSGDELHYLDKDVYASLMNSVFDEADKVLSVSPEKARMMNKIKGAYQRGANEKVERFLMRNGIHLTKIERDALRSRNRMAHPTLGHEDHDAWDEILRMSRAYETLFHRTILKVLGYSGKYIDYYTLGHPMRELDQGIPSDSSS